MGSEISDFVGYGASLFVVLSFIVKEVKKIRIINFIGCSLFVLYGILKGEGNWSAMYWPVIIPNFIICFVQVYHLLRLHKKSSEQ
ncbi:MAG: uroporphyrinogen decarboxylase [Bacteroidetes bacterium]|nr:uroporphyrinogen decarboxylase [Bacteroidota bacterium]